MASRVTMVLVAAVILLVQASPAWSHAGYEHVIGTIVAIDGGRVEIKTKTAQRSIALTPDTRYYRRGNDVPRQVFTVGTTVLVDGRREKGAFVAKEIRLVVSEAAE